MRYLFLAIALILSSCTNWAERAHNNNTSEVERLAEESRQRDNNPNTYNYNLGTRDGCSSGKNATGSLGYAFTKNVDLYVGNPYYKSGWDDGMIKCKTEGENLNNIIRDSIR
jgi:hypothetical protein